MRKRMMLIVLIFVLLLLGCQNLPAESAVGPNDSSSKSAMREYAIGWDVNSFQPVMVSYPESHAEQDAKEWAQESLDIDESGNHESTQSVAIPYDISKSNFTQERWGTIFYSDYWIANRMSVDVGPTPAHRKSWMNVYANQGSWDECVFHREPEQEWYLIQYIGTSEHYVFWTETIPYLEFSEIGDTHWQLYCYDIEKEETRLVLDSEQKKWSSGRKSMRLMISCPSILLIRKAMERLWNMIPGLTNSVICITKTVRAFMWITGFMVLTVF